MSKSRHLRCQHLCDARIFLINACDRCAVWSSSASGELCGKADHCNILFNEILCVYIRFIRKGRLGLDRGPVVLGVTNCVDHP